MCLLERHIPGVPINKKNRWIIFPYVNAWEHYDDNSLAYADIPFNAILFHTNVDGLLYCNITQYGYNKKSNFISYKATWKRSKIESNTSKIKAS